MNIAIIASTLDKASINIRDNLISSFNKTPQTYMGHHIFVLNNIKIITLISELLYQNNLDTSIGSDLFVFISKHKGKKKVPTLSVHSIGNWDSNDLGGEQKKLVLSSALILRKIYISLIKNCSNLNYEIVFEATHHGPYLDKPSCFVEIGSTEKEWTDPIAGSLVAKSILDALVNSSTLFDSNCEIAIGIGGLHTCPEFNKVVSRNKIAISHICPKYMLPKLNKEMIKEAINKTVEKVDLVLLDWKGLGKEKQKVIKILVDLKFDVKKTTDFKS